MTSQEEKEAATFELLKAEAKELNVPGWQATKDPEKLRKKVEEAKKGTIRKKPPEMVITQGRGNDRNSMLKALMAKDPDCEYMTQNANFTAADAEAKGFEIVKKDNGELMYIGSDIVVRTGKESFNKWQKNRTEQSLQAMKSIDKDLSTEAGGQMIQAATERPKKGIDPS